MKTLFKTIAVSITIPLVQSCSLFGIRNLEEPNYQVKIKEGDIEVRQYSSHLVAKTKVEGTYDNSQNKAFRILAGYIFGGNQTRESIAMTAPVSGSKSEKIAMTAPVNQEIGEGYYTMSFMMPARFSKDTLPVPNDKRIWFEEIPSKVMAVIPFSWWGSEDRYRDYATVLYNWLEKDGRYQPVALPNYAGYNPPWTIPWLRTNEVMIEVVPRDVQVTQK